MPIKKSELYSSLWASCDELRGGMDAPQYKDYVLVLLFVKYVSDKAVSQKGYLLNGIPAMSKYAESATINPIEFERFGSPRSLNSNSVAFDEIRAARVPSYLQAGGLPAISRWLSEAQATPPERSDETQCSPKGCQRETGVRTGFRGGQMRGGLRSLRDRGACAGSGGFGSLNPRLMARIPAGCLPTPAWISGELGEYHVRSGSTKQELKGATLDRFLLRK